MRVIDLLNKIANKEKVPKKIKWNSETYKYNGRWEDYEIETGSGYFFQTMLNRNRDMSLILTDEIEIIEEVEDKEYEDIDIDFESGDSSFVVTQMISKIKKLIRNQQKIIKQLENK